MGDAFSVPFILSWEEPILTNAWIPEVFCCMRRLSSNDKDLSNPETTRQSFWHALTVGTISTISWTIELLYFILGEVT